MSTPLPVTIDGVRFNAQAEYTSSDVAAEYQNSLAAFVNIFNLGLSPTNSAVNPSSSTLSADITNALQNDSTYATQLRNALLGGTVTLNYQSTDPLKPPQQVQVTGLLNLLKNGINNTQNPTVPATQYMTTSMANALQQLIATLEMAGIDIQQSGQGLTVAGLITSQMLQNWKNLADSSTAVQQILQSAGVAATSDNRTLQALVQLIYVQTGNQILSSNLTNLQNALEATNNALGTLNSLQSLSNKVTTTKPGGFTAFAQSTYNLGSNRPSAFAKGSGGVPSIAAAATTYFQGIDPTILGTITTSDLTNFMDLRVSLINEIRALSGQTPGTASTQGGTLVGRLRTVLADINAAFVAVGLPSGLIGGYATNTTYVRSALVRWLIDSNAVVNTALNIAGLGAGQVQRNLAAAITAGQSLNATQQQNVQQYMFVFQQYYQSAAAILNGITQIIQTMAQNMAR